MKENCQHSNSVGLTQEIADELWWRAKKIAGVEDTTTLNTIKVQQEKLYLARRIFAELAFDYPHYASIKEVAFFCNANVNIIGAIRNEWLQRQRSERNKPQWTFKTCRTKSTEHYLLSPPTGTTT